jgi:acetyl-CoA synthetase
MRQPWPGMLRTLYGDDDRYRDQYFSESPRRYFAGDGARRDEDGYYWIMGRVDDVLNVSGHRLGTMEIESALVSHPPSPRPPSSAAPHEIKGQGIVRLRDAGARLRPVGAEKLREELREHVAQEIGAIAKPDDLRFADALPKTRSGKIMRRLLRDVASKRAGSCKFQF